MKEISQIAIKILETEYVNNYDRNQLIEIIKYRYPKFKDNASLSDAVIYAYSNLDTDFLRIKRAIHLTYFQNWLQNSKINSTDLKTIFANYNSTDDKNYALRTIIDFIEFNNFSSITFRNNISDAKESDILTGNWVQNSDSEIIERFIKYINKKPYILNHEFIPFFEEIKQSRREDFSAHYLNCLKENEFYPEEEVYLYDKYSKLTKTNWIKKEVATGGGNIEEPPQNFHPLLAPVAQYVVDLQQFNIPKIKEKFNALNDNGIQKILENLIALRIISSGKDLRLLVQNQSELNLIFDLNHIKYTSYIKDPLPPPPPKDDAQIKNKLQTYYTANNYDFITKSQLADLYHTFQNDFSVTKIENIVSSFLDKNDLIPEQKPKGVSFREQHCSTNWVHKKVAPAFHWSVYGKYISYLTLIGFIILCVYYGAKSLNSGIVYRTIAYDGANIRNTTNTGSDESIKEKITYGGPFKIKHETDMVSGEGGMWLKKDGWFSDRYVSAKIFVTEPDFYILESAFADETTKNTIQTVKTRKAIIDYFKRNNLFGKLDANIYEEVYKQSNTNTEVWQVQCEPWQSGVPNSIIYPKVTDPHSKYTDFGFIVTNKNNNIKKFALYRFDAITEEPIFVGEEDATGYTVVNSVSIRSNGTLSVNMH